MNTCYFNMLFFLHHIFGSRVLWCSMASQIIFSLHLEGWLDDISQMTRLIIKAVLLSVCKTPLCYRQPQATRSFSVSRYQIFHHWLNMLNTILKWITITRRPHLWHLHLATWTLLLSHCQASHLIHWRFFTRRTISYHFHCIMVQCRHKVIILTMSYNCPIYKELRKFSTLNLTYTAATNLLALVSYIVHSALYFT